MTLLNSFSSSLTLFVDCFRHSTQMTMFSANIFSLIFFFPIWMSFISFSFLIALVRTTNKMLITVWVRISLSSSKPGENILSLSSLSFILAVFFFSFLLCKCCFFSWGSGGRFLLFLVYWGFWSWMNVEFYPNAFPLSFHS